MKRSKDLAGKKIGLLTIIERAEPFKDSSGRSRPRWKCQCLCGKIVCVNGSNLLRKTKPTLSCGCFKKNKIKYNWTDLTGQIFGQLTVLHKHDKLSKSRGSLWVCLCECGKQVRVSSNGLTSGNNKTCGDKIHRNGVYCGQIPLQHITTIRSNATKRNLPFDVTPEYLDVLFESQNHKCAISGVELSFTQSTNPSMGRSKETTASLDRIDNNNGYVLGNVRWVHKDINKMMSNHGDEKFYSICSQCVNHRYNSIIRPTWEEYFLMLALDISVRSDDPNMKVGAVITTKDNIIISTGYNGTIRGSDIEKIPLNDRDIKRKYMVHAEQNAMLNCYNKQTECILYVTALPCISCLQSMINFGIVKIVYIDRIGTITEDSTTNDIRNNLLSMSKIETIGVSPDNVWVNKNLDNMYNPYLSGDGKNKIISKNS